MSLRLSNILWLLVLLALLAGGVWVVQRARQPVPVVAQQVEPGPAVQQLAVVGRVRTRDVVSVKAENPGAVVQMFRDEGDRVSKGELLARIRFDQPRAAAAASKAQIRAQEAQITLARQQLARIEPLARQGWATRAALDQARANLAAAVASRDALVASAAQTSARAREFEVRAPMAGTILFRPVDPGQVVSLSDTLFEMGSAGQIEIEAEVDEYFADAVKPGAKVVLMPSGSSLKLPGRVSEVSPRIDARTGGRLVRFMPDISDASLRPGRSVDTTIEVSRRDQVISVPRTALVKRKGEWQVLLVEGGQVASRNVAIEDWPGTSVIVRSGLKAGDAVILEPLSVAIGKKVRAIAPSDGQAEKRVERPVSR